MCVTISPLAFILKVHKIIYSGGAQKECTLCCMFVGYVRVCVRVDLHVYKCVSGPFTVGACCSLRAGGWPERVKADNQGEFHDAHTSCSLKFY